MSAHTKLHSIEEALDSSGSTGRAFTIFDCNFVSENFCSLQSEIFAQQEFEAHQAKRHQLGKDSQLIGTIDTKNGSHPLVFINTPDSFFAQAGGVDLSFPLGACNP